MDQGDRDFDRGCSSDAGAFHPRRCVLPSLGRGRIASRVKEGKLVACSRICDEFSSSRHTNRVNFAPGEELKIPRPAEQEVELMNVLHLVRRVSRADRPLNETALAVAGRTRGGVAKVSVISSALLGTINGSAIANVVTVGSFTIPLMKRSGFSPAYPAAVEATASMGGQLMPPIMGVAAFQVEALNPLVQWCRVLARLTTARRTVGVNRR